LSQLERRLIERRLTEEIASAIGYGEKMKASYDREVSERKRMTEMYLEANQACIDAEAEVERLREEISLWHDTLDGSEDLPLDVCHVMSRNGEGQGRRGTGMSALKFDLHEGGMVPSTHGAYVDSGEYDFLAAEREDLQAEVENLVVLANKERSERIKIYENLVKTVQCNFDNRNYEDLQAKVERLREDLYQEYKFGFKQGMNRKILMTRKDYHKNYEQAKAEGGKR